MVALIFLTSLTTVAILIYYYFYKFSGKNLPLGPLPLPFIGNLHLLGQNLHFNLKELADKYGKVFRLYIGEKLVVVLSSDAIREALVRKPADFAGRPSMYFYKIALRDDPLSQRFLPPSDFGSSGEGDHPDVCLPVPNIHPDGPLSPRNQNRWGAEIAVTPPLVLIDYGTQWRIHRRLAHRTIKIYGTNRYEKIIQREITELCKRFKFKEDLGEAVEIKKEIGLAIMNVICNKIFGSRYDVGDLEFLEMFHLQAELFRLSTVAARGLVDLFPILRFILPVSGDVKQLRITNDRWREILLTKYREHQKTFDKDNLRDYTDVILNARREAEELNSKDLEYLQDKHLISSITTLFIAGSETAATTLDWAVLYLLHFPDIQRRLHAEIDRVAGRKEIVTLDMRKRFPYLEAFICETLRYTSILPLSVPHMTTVDTTLDGYDIPQGTTVIVNIWALHRDPLFWKDPDDFDPDRFLDSKGDFVFPDGDYFLPFGAGPRSCMGEVIARCELFLFLANVLQKFTFENPPGIALPSLEHLPGGAVLQPAIEQVRVKTRPVKGYASTGV